VNPDIRTRNRSTAAQPGSIRLGERLRQLRVSAGLTQTDLAGDRFSKEYVSQIERGKTRPTAETVEWLASQLGVDPGFLANGVSTDERGRVEASLARVEALLESDSVAEAAEEIANLRTAVRATGVTELEARVLLNDVKVKARLGEVREALEILTQLRTIVEGPPFSDVERAEVLFMFGVCRFKLASVQTSLGLLSEALKLAEGSGLPCDRLRSDILNWRSRCYRSQRDFEAAREDVERALELAEALGDRRALANANFQASIVAERQGHWVLARTYAERAKAQYEELSSRESVGRLLNNLGGLNLLLGKPEDAEALLKDSFRVALEVGNDADAARAVSSLAQVHMRMGDHALAEEQARHALRLLDGREDYLDEIGNAQLVLGRALLEVGRLDEADVAFHDAASSFDQLSSASHRAAAWVAQGDLAAVRGDDRTAARLYRAAAEALQDFRF
jgi:transcriptional regulator with XRE-family HTH domain